MEWIYVGMFLGSMVTSSHATQEACEGRKVMLDKKGVIGQCVKQQSSLTVGITSYPGFYNQGN